MKFILENGRTLFFSVILFVSSNIPYVHNILGGYILESMLS